jgi:prepilin peptidase CpaA
MVLFAMGAIGGGDAKFYSAISAWFAIEEAFRLLFSVSLVGLVLALLFWRGRKLVGPPGSGAGSGSHLMVPFGVAIAAGAVIRKAALVLA